MMKFAQTTEMNASDQNASKQRMAELIQRFGSDPRVLETRERFVPVVNPGQTERKATIDLVKLIEEYGPYAGQALQYAHPSIFVQPENASIPVRLEVEAALKQAFPDELLVPDYRLFENSGR